MPTDRRRRRGEDTRARIMSAAAELFAAQGFDATSTQTIAAASGITVAAIYRHVPSKADLLVAVARHALETTFTETMTDVGPSTAAQRIADIVVAYTEPQREFTRRLVVELTHAAAQHPEVATLAADLPPTGATAHRRRARGGPARRVTAVRRRRHACRARRPAADHGHLPHRRPRSRRPRRSRMASFAPPHRPRHDRLPIRTQAGRTVRRTPAAAPVVALRLTPSTAADAAGGALQRRLSDEDVTRVASDRRSCGRGSGATTSPG